jgi:hypothetical protein
VLARAGFEGTWKGKRVLLIAEAYDGARMKSALTDFLSAAAGRLTRDFDVTSGKEKAGVQAGGLADLVCFVGHNGLMDVALETVPENTGGPNPRFAVVLACKSRDFFLAPLARAKCAPLITTSQLMAPEAYTLDAIVRSWAAGADPEAVRRKAAAAYAKYQKCSVAAAERIFVAGGK